MPEFNVQSFSNISNPFITHLADNIGSIKLSGGELKRVSGASEFFTLASTHRKTISAFIEAVRQEYGDDIADMASRNLADRFKDGKPLTSFTVKSVLFIANGMKGVENDRNRSTVETFVADKDNGLEKALGEFCDSKGIPPGKRGVIVDHVAAHLRGKAERGEFSPGLISRETLAFNVGRAMENFVGGDVNALRIALGADGAGLPGTEGDKLRLAELGLGNHDDFAFFRAAWELPALRQANPEGEITPAMVWRAMFKEDLPEGMDVSPDAFGLAVWKKVEAEAESLAGLTGRRETTLLTASCQMPWDKVKTLAVNPDRVTLADVPNIKSLIGHIGDRKAALRSLAMDPMRQGIEPPTPTFTFNFGEGLSKTVQIGPRSDFPFPDDDDKEAYLRGRPNALSHSLEVFSKAVCEGGSEKQITNVMLCLGQCSLLPLKNLGRLLGTNFSEHSNVSVSLTRLENGTVRAVFASPPEFDGEAGHFDMTLDIDPDGEMTMKEFNVSPDTATLQTRQVERDTAARAAQVNRDIAARAARGRESLGLASDLLKEESFLAMMKTQAQTLGIDVNAVGPTLAKKLMKGVREQIAAAATKAADPISRQQSLEICRQAMAGYFDRLKAAADTITDGAGRNRFVNACLELGATPRPDFAPAIAQLSNGAAVVLREIISAGSEDGIIEALRNYEQVWRGTWQATFVDIEESGGKQPESDDVSNMGVIALSMAWDEIRGATDSDSMAAGLTRQGSLFRDAVYTINHSIERPDFTEVTVEISPEVKALGYLTTALGPKLSPKAMSQLGTTLLEGDLSIAKQRRLIGQGQVFQARGTVLPGLDDAAAVNRDLQVIQDDVKAQVEDEFKKALPETPDDPRAGNPDHSDWRVDDTFFVDCFRGGIFIDGQRFLPVAKVAGNPQREEVEGVFGFFPDRRTAAIVTSIACQTLYGMFSNNFTPEKRAKLEKGEELFKATLGNPELWELKSDRVSIGVETLDQAAGKYRVYVYREATSGANGPDTVPNGTERYLSEVSVEITVGGETPVVDSVKVDMLLRGRDWVPGEEREPSENFLMFQ